MHLLACFYRCRQQTSCLSLSLYTIIFLFLFLSFSLSFDALLWNLSKYLLWNLYLKSSAATMSSRKMYLGYSYWYFDIMYLGREDIKISCVGCEILLLNNFGSKQFLVRRIFFTLLLDEALRPGISSVETFAWRGGSHHNIDMSLYFLGIFVSWHTSYLSFFLHMKNFGE